ncbi:MAG: helicase-related protein [Sulfolobales archaeon]
MIKYDGDVSSHIRDYHARKALVVLTNPEILLDILEKKSNHKLWNFITNVKMIVIDELDYYNSRGATVLLHLIKRFIERLGTKPQIAILGATIRNVKAIKDFFPTIDFDVIGGQAPRPANYLYIVLGKRDLVKNLYSKLPGSQGLTYDEYKEKFFELLLYFKDKNYIDAIVKGNESSIEDLVKEYQKCLETTLIFAKNIDEANKIGSSLDPNLSAVHHSKISKKDRSSIEEKARKGEVKVIVTVKTLLQGIDIGYIARVIHIGLPLTLREFIQREGRKGRRLDVERTESIVLPIREGDIILLSEGLKSLEMWRSLEPEILILNPENDLLKLYDAKLGFRSLTSDELLNRELAKLEFYEIYKYYYGIPVYLYDPSANSYEPEGECSLREYIEEYQPGSIDTQTQPALIISTYDNRNKEPAVLKVVPNYALTLQYMCEAPHCDISRTREWKTPKSIMNALSEYERICREWRQQPNLLEDIRRRKLWSKVYTTLLFSGLGGFKLVKEYPILVRWYLESRNKRKVFLDNGIAIDVYDMRAIDVFRKPKVKSPYRFFTYVYVSDLDPKDLNLEKIIRGVGFLKALLRHKYGLPLDTIEYSFEYFSGLLKIWEKEPIGLIKSLRNKGKIQIDEDRVIGCVELINDIKAYQIDDKFKLLLKYIDRYSFSEEVLADPGRLNEIREDAERMVYYLCNMISIKLKEEIKLISRTPRESILILDSAFGKVSISLATPELGIEILEIISVSDHKAFSNKILEALSKHPDLRYIVHYGLENNLINKVPSMLSDKVIDLSTQITSKYLAPASLGRIRAELMEREDLIEIQNEISSKHLRDEKVDEDSYRRFFKLRAETIAILYNLYRGYTT